MISNNANQTKRGQFQLGNRYGVATRFTPGRSGNPRGRPPHAATFLRRYRARGCDQAALTRIINDMAQPRNPRIAAMQMVTSMIVRLPIAGADPIRSRRLFHRNRYMQTRR
jgi:hypothetical protein